MRLSSILSFVVAAFAGFAASAEKTISITATTTVDELAVTEDTVLDVAASMTYTVKKISGGDFKLVKTGSGALTIATGTGGSTFTGSLYVSNGVFTASGNEPFGPVNAEGTSKVYIHSADAIGYNGNNNTIRFQGFTTAKPIEMIVSGGGNNQRQMQIPANATNVFNGAVVWKHHPSSATFMPSFGAGSQMVFAGGLTDQNTTYLILGADKTKSGSGAEIVFRNKPLVTTGVFTARWNTGWGSGADLDGMGGRVIFQVAGNQVSSLGQAGKYTWAVSTIVLDCEGDVFDPSVEQIVGLGSVMQPTNALIDVHGGDRRIGTLKSRANEAGLYDTSGFVNFGSKPGTIRVKQAADATVGHGCFNDVTFVKEGAKTLTFTNATWETSGNVIAAEGTLVFSAETHFENVKHVIVSNGATLKFTGGGTMNGLQRLKIADGGTFAIADGKTETVLCCEVNGSLLPPDTYATYGGSLVVLSDTIIDGEIVFDIASGETVNDKLYGGEGNIVKRGAGRLTFTGDQGYLGGLVVEAGTLEIGADTEWSRVTNVVVESGATLLVSSTAAFPDDQVSFTFETGATLCLADGVAIVATGASLDGTALTAGGTYTGTDNPNPGSLLTSLAVLKGNGTFSYPYVPVPTVAVAWTDGGADDSVWTSGNWSAAPNLRDGSALATFAQAGDGATVSGTPIFAGLVFAGATDFTIASDDGHALRLGSSGIATDADAGAATVFAVSAPVEPVADQTWTIGRETKLTGGLAGNSADVTVTRQGTGQLTIGGGASTFPGSFVIDTAGATKTIATGTDPFGPAAEGSAITVKCTGTSGGLTFKDAVITKDIVEKCSGFGNSTLVGFSGSVEFKGLYTHTDGMRLSPCKNLVFSGGFSSSGVRFNTYAGLVVFTNKSVTADYIRTMYGTKTDGNLTVRLAVDGNSIGKIGQSDSTERGGGGQPWQYAVLYTDVDYALNSVTMPVILGDGGHIDLNGHDQVVGSLCSYRMEPALNLPISIRNTGSKTATIAVNQSTDYVEACTVEGPVNFVKKGANTITITNAWTSTGFVEVQAGTIVLASEGTWTTPSEFRLTGGTLSFSTPAAIVGTARPVIVFGQDAADGCLSIPEEVSVGKTYYTDGDGNRVPVARGVYRAGDGSAIGQYLTGSGSLRVCKSDIPVGLVFIIN